MDRIWYEFKRENIVIPFPIRDVRPMNDVVAKEALAHESAVADCRKLLSEISLFEALSPEERVITLDVTQWVEEATPGELHSSRDIL